MIWKYCLSHLGSVWEGTGHEFALVSGMVRSELDMKYMHILHELSHFSHFQGDDSLNLLVCPLSTFVFASNRSTGLYSDEAEILYR